MINQKKKSSFFSSFLFFLGVLGLLFAIFFFGYYQRSYLARNNDSANNFLRENPPQETFVPFPKDLLPPKVSKEEKKFEKLTRWQIGERIRIQNHWKQTALPRLFSDEGIEEVNKFLSHFYKEFLENGLRGIERKWQREIQLIRPKEVAGRATTEETRVNDIERCKEIFPEIRKASIDWKGFDGWLSENEKGEEDKKDNKTVTMGLCINSEKGGGIWGGTKITRWWTEEIKRNWCYWTHRFISIKLKPELFFNHRDYWVTVDEETGGYSQLGIGWDQLIETIAHELAHAVINTILINDKVARLKEGHGGLHDAFTKRIKDMIEMSPEYNKFHSYVRGLN